MSNYLIDICILRCEARQLNVPSLLANIFGRVAKRHNIVGTHLTVSALLLVYVLFPLY